MTAAHFQSAHSVSKSNSSYCDRERKKRKITQGASSVRFNDDIQIQEIPDRSILSQDQRNQMYLSRDDQLLIYKEIASVIEKTVNEKFDESYEEDAHAELRGLESIARLDSARIQQRRAVSIVLRRQLIGKIDEAWLALVYRPFSEAAARLAYRRGLRDQEVAPSPVPKQKVMIR